jgi:hypothetical protein
VKRVVARHARHAGNQQGQGRSGNWVRHW